MNATELIDTLRQDAIDQRAVTDHLVTLAKVRHPFFTGIPNSTVYVEARGTHSFNLSTTGNSCCGRTVALLY